MAIARPGVGDDTFGGEAVAAGLRRDVGLVAGQSFGPEPVSGDCPPGQLVAFLLRWFGRLALSLAQAGVHEVRLNARWNCNAGKLNPHNWKRREDAW